MNKLMSKTQLMQLILNSGDNVHELFTHETDGQFDITLMRKLAKETNQVELRPMRFLPQTIDEILNDRAINFSRINDLSYEDWANDPIMMVEYVSNNEPKNQLLIDGVHRLVCRALVHHLFTVNAYVFREDQIIRPNTTQFVRGEQLGIDWKHSPIKKKNL